MSDDRQPDRDIRVRLRSEDYRPASIRSPRWALRVPVSLLTAADRAEIERRRKLREQAA